MPSREEIRWMKMSFSYCAEDLVILEKVRKLELKNSIYIDVGAFDPIAYSNTLLLYHAGWSGINVDLDSEKINRFKKLRKRDHCVKAAVSFNKRAVRHARYASGFSNRILEIHEADERSNLGELPLSIDTIQTSTLTEIIDASPFSGKTIGFLDVDCEGRDIEVLQGLNFEKYAPKIIAVEAFDDKDRIAVSNFLKPKGYKISDIVDITTLFIQESL
jgi:FkbM family methyltransferase